MTTNITNPAIAFLLLAVAGISQAQSLIPVSARPVQELLVDSVRRAPVLLKRTVRRSCLHNSLTVLLKQLRPIKNELQNST
jgi:hypothetical protein